MRAPGWILTTCLLAACGQGAPDAQAMRAHRISSMTDAQLRELHADAEREAAAQIAASAARAEESKKADAERRRLCGDLAYSTRNPASCGAGGIGAMFPVPVRVSVEAIFEEKIMGMCNFAKTERQARSFGCLPAS